MMDQPGRCRRTDGKRWRCSKDVIPNEKYCQNHMHRGCRRSRKLVEASITDPNTPRNGHVSHSNNTIVRGAKDPSNRTTKITFKPASKMEGKANGCDYQRLKRETVVARDKLPSAGGKHPKSSNAKVEEEERLKTEASNTVNLEFSPKSVLGQGECFSAVNQSNRQSVVAAGDLEPRRCRRTDGKRWRCTEEVIAGDHKYCSKHMYRGAKKRPQQGECNPFALVKRADKLVVGFDTNLSS